jgi:hypothetical protein
VKFRANLNTEDFRAGFEAMRNRLPRVVQRSLFRAGKSGRTAMVRMMRQDTGLPAKRIRDDIKVETQGFDTVKLTVSGGRIGLIHFRARGPEPSRGRGRGVTYRNPGSPGRLPHAFIATMPTGHRGVFKRDVSRRRARGSRGRTQRQDPIVELFGPSLVRVFEKFIPEGIERTKEQLIKYLRNEVSRALNRR